MEVREERAGEADAVDAVHLVAFGDYGESVSGLSADLRRAMTPLTGVSLVMEHEGEIVGNVMFTRCILDAPRRMVDVQCLSPVGVLPRWHGQGVGSALIRHGIDLMRERAVPVIFLEGEPGYYSRFGFVPGGPLGFRRPSLRIPEPAFQALPLASLEPWMTGTLVYAQAFWDHDAVGLRDDVAADV